MQRLPDHLLLATALLVCGAGHPAVCIAASDEVPRERVLDDIGKLIPRHFAHWQGVPDFDFDSEFAAYRREALALPGREEFSERTRRFVASLRNGHTRFDDAQVDVPSPPLGFALRHVGSQWVVSASQRSELPTGSVVEGIDGTTMEDWYLGRRDRISASSERMRRYLFTSLPDNFPLRFELELAGAQRVVIDRNEEPPSAVAPPMVEHRWLVPEDVAYLRIRSFARDEYQRAALDVLRAEYRDARRVIIDVRGNGGGTTPTALGRAILGKQWKSWQRRPAASPTAIPPKPETLTPRYLVLIDRGCGSACEDFAMPIRLDSHALVIGETTAGSSGQPRFFDWDNGMSIMIGARRLWFPGGAEFEGVGVDPDLAIELRADDFTAGAPDRILLCAQHVAMDRRAECR
jgi:carboxyl-terminal processing protease